MPVLSTSRNDPLTQPPSATSSPPGSFHCNVCSQLIPAASPRVNCLTCLDVDLCAICALGDPFQGGHMAEHPTRTYRISGDSELLPIVSQASISYTPTLSSGVTSNGSTSSGGLMTTPGAMNRSTSAGITPPETTSMGGAAVSPTRRPPPSSPGGWGQFFYMDMRPTPTFVELIGALFSHLDPARTGILAPEAYSRLLDDMGYAVHENIWKSNLGNPPLRNEAAADAALKRACDVFGIEHVVQARATPTSSNFMKFIQGGVAGQMPLLTVRGLVDLSAIELLSDPANAWQKLARVVQLYGLYGIEPYRRWGALPRSVLPAGPDPRMVARVAGAQAHSVQAANVSAQIQASANRAAVNAIGGSEYTYRYI